MKYTTSNGWVVNTRKLKTDDRLYLSELETDSQRTEFADECVSLYLKAWGIDLIDMKASMKEAGK
jgi:hypothetical protein